MNTFQKERISFLRNAGYGYGKIAAELGISVNTVKSYCRRNSIIAAAKSENAVQCANCSATLIHKTGAKKKRFCCDKCRVLWWNSHPEAVGRKAVYNFTCAACGKEFTVYVSKDRKYCSHECYINSRFKGGGS